MERKPQRERSLNQYKKIKSKYYHYIEKERVVPKDDRFFVLIEMLKFTDELFGMSYEIRENPRHILIMLGMLFLDQKDKEMVDRYIRNAGYTPDWYRRKIKSFWNKDLTLTWKGEVHPSAEEYYNTLEKHFRKLAGK